ncbi:MAG: glycoside hydrolase family 44 protein [Caldilineaceae bacterium]
MKYAQPADRPKWLLHCLLTFCLLGSLIVTANTPVAPLWADAPQATDLVIYNDALATGWENWSWDTTANFASMVVAHSGTQSVAVTYQKAWAGLSLRASAPINTAGFNAVEFWVYGGAGDSQLSFFTQATDNGGNSSTVPVNAPAGTWTRFQVSLNALGNPAAIARLNWQDATGTAQLAFSVDDIRLVATSTGNGGFPDTTADGSRTFAPGPSGVAIAPSGRVYVAVYQDDRVYSWPNLASMTSGAAPDQTFGVANGDPDNGCTKGPSATVLCGPESVAVDGAGNLYITDTYNHRVLIFTKAENDPNRTTADVVLGQPNFTSNNTNYDSNKADGIVEGFYNPRALAVDKNNNLYVVDEFNHRVLKFNQPLTTDHLPDLVIGQDTLNTAPGMDNSGQSGDNRFNLPLGVAVDSTGRVYVTDYNNNRVLGFATPNTNGATADVKLTSLNHAHDVAVDAKDNLYVADTYNSHVLVFATPVASGAASAYEFPGLSFPMGMAFDAAGDFAVANCGPHSVAAPTDYPPCLADPRDVRVFNAPTNTPADITLTLDVNADRKPISPDIYGMNWADEALAKELSIPVRRWGGNATSRYNWKNDIGNHAIDWYFENIKESDAVNLPDDSSVNRFIAQDRRTGTRTFLTVPMSGWVSSNDANACGYSTAKYNYTPAVNPDGAASVAPDRANCGNGVTQYKNGHSWEPVFYQGNDPKDTSIAITGAFAGDWTTYLKNHFGAADAGGVRFYGLDNEPELWNTSHADVHPAGLSYDELGNSTIEYAAAIKASDPTAQVLGPEFGGWWGFFDSTKDTAAGNDVDRQAHGSQPIIEWYLDQLASYEKTKGVRLLDYLDLHFYPQDDGVFLDPQRVDPAGQAKRLDSVRALWDPTYQETSWIKDTADGPYVRLIPRMHEWVNQHYPGTKIGLSEYGWGALDHINGALAQADILGVLGREAVDLAALWGPPEPNQPGAYAFRMYRNYDGSGSQFGDTSVHAASTDQGKLAVYAAQRGSDSELTVMIINKTAGALTSKINLANFAATTAQVYRYSAANLNTIEHLADQAVNPNGFTVTFPANSITLMVVPSADNAPTPTPTATNPSSGNPTPTATPTPPGGAPARKLFLPMVKR